ncbi:MAG: DNA-protecting protein DprA [Flavipsychrobacter sp.]|nr:DNA-protecting protein DprA [Flavipsychrobacter sp.]
MLPTGIDQETFYQLALTFVPDVGAKTARALYEHFGTATHIFNAPLKEIKAIAGIDEKRSKGFRDDDVLRKTEAELNIVARHGINILNYRNGNYPARLAQCVDAPLIVYYRGNANLDAQKIVAIVGTRKSTDYGNRLVDELVEGLRAHEDMLIISGLAAGIDTLAHRKCVELNIPTVGVLGHGLDRMYPVANKKLAKEMMENGGLLTEFPFETVPDKGKFPMRNRVVAGLADVTIVVESAISGGALITARMASGYNRDVAAYPGRVNDSRSAGCNKLIRTNIAGMITCADDLLDMMNWGKSKSKAVQKELFINLTPEEQKIIDILQTKDQVHADELYHQTGYTSSQLAATLLQLEMQDLVKSLPGKFYRMN